MSKSHLAGQNMPPWKAGVITLGTGLAFGLIAQQVPEGTFYTDCIAAMVGLAIGWLYADHGFKKDIEEIADQIEYRRRRGMD